MSAYKPTLELGINNLQPGPLLRDVDRLLKRLSIKFRKRRLPLRIAQPGPCPDGVRLSDEVRRVLGLLGLLERDVRQLEKFRQEGECALGQESVEVHDNSRRVKPRVGERDVEQRGENRLECQE